MATKQSKSRREHSEEARKRIKSTIILDHLQQHVEGKKEMKSTQIRAAEILLRKIIPDLSATTLANDSENPLPIGFNLIPVKPDGNKS